jgi:hypothetical protein
MHRSCLVLLLTATLLIVMGVIIWRQTRVGDTAAVATPAAQRVAAQSGREGLGDILGRLFGLHREPTPVPLGPELSETLAAGFAGTPGLRWKLTRPLPVEVAEVGGLAADESAFYLSASDTAQNTADIWRLQAARLTVEAHVEQGAGWTAGGLSRGETWLWAALMAPQGDAAQADGVAAVVLGFDPETLGEERRIPCDLRVRAVAEDARGRLTGVSEDGAWLVQWSAEDGSELQRKANPTGVAYHDLEFVNGSLVAGGAGTDHGWLDVLDPDSLTLLLRQRTDVRLDDGAWLTGGGVAYSGEVFYFLPSGGEGPALSAYGLDEVTLDEYVPHIAGAAY